MSRLYEMHVKVIGFNPKRMEEIKEAASGEWMMFEDDWSDNIKFVKGKEPIEMSTYGEDTLGAGEDEESFARRLASAIMKANRKPCEVEVHATCLEDLPYQSYTFDKEDFKELSR